MAKSQIAELVIKRDQLKSALYLNSFRTVLDYNEALENHRKLRKPITLDQQTEKLAGVLNEAGESASPNLELVKTSVQALISDVVQTETALAAFRTARAKIDRLLLRGYYERLLPHLPSLDL